MSLSVLDEEQLNLITDFFNEHPSGLGKREIWRSLKGQISRNTIDKIIAYLIKTGSMRVEPNEDSRRQGQKGRYILIESNDFYKEFLEKIGSETKKYVFILDTYVESSIETEPNINALIKYTQKVYTLYHLMEVLDSWNVDWKNDMEVMREILDLWYLSYRKVNRIIGKIVLKNLDTINRNLREQRKNIEKNHPGEVFQLDKFEAFLNFYRKPEQKLDALYQDIEVNNDDDKKS